MGGYDRRRYINGRQRISYRNSASFPIKTTYDVAASVCSVVSYRTNPTGELVLDSTADPYAHFLSEVSNRRRIAANAARKLGSNAPWTVDNGHAFRLERHSISPRENKSLWYSNLYPIYEIGGPVTTCGAYVFNAEQPRMLFKYKDGQDTVEMRPYVTPFAHLSDWDVNLYGTRAIQTLAPTRPEMNLSASVAELVREGLPKAALFNSLNQILRQVTRIRHGSRGPKQETSWQAALKGLASGSKGASEDYLNFMFGISPLARDIESLYTVLKNSENILAQYQTDAGKGVRRDMVLKDTVENATFRPSDLFSQGTVGVFTNHWPASFPPGRASTSDTADSSTTQTTVFQELKEKIYFSGSFSYYLPLPEGFWGKMKFYDSQWERLIGRPLSYETLWELTPWSWLADWFFDIQGALRTVDLVQDDNLVINYGYLMRSVTATTTVVSQLGWSPEKDRAIKTASTQYVSHRVERVRANPFGFALTAPTALSAVQLSLLGAIGLSRGIK